MSCFVLFGSSAKSPRKLFYQNLKEFDITEGAKVGQFTVGNCFRLDFDITPIQNRNGVYCNIMLLGYVCALNIPFLRECVLL